ncbi:MAG: hypothetical protein ACRC8J_00885, partial [Phocaeicola sp.]
MKKFLSSLLFFVGSLGTGYAQQNDYIVSTTSTQQQQEETQAVSSPEKQFIDSYFTYYNLCDWKPGMKFMVIPERKDMVMPIFKVKETNRDINTADLKHKILEYLGVEITERNFIHFNFECDGVTYCHEVRNTTLDQYCQKLKSGIPSLAFLQDVDIAKEALVGQTFYMRTNKVCVDDANSTTGFREVPISLNEKVVITAVGVGTRSFPVKIIFTDEKGKSYFLPVAISKTNCGMLDKDFVMDNKNKYFPNAFSFTDSNAKKEEGLMGIYGGKPVYLKNDTELTDVNGRSVKFSKYEQFTIKHITSEKNSNYVMLELVGPEDKIYTIRATFSSTSTVDTILQTGNHFTELFNIGNLKLQYPEITEEEW